MVSTRLQKALEDKIVEGQEIITLDRCDAVVDKFDIPVSLIGADKVATAVAVDPQNRSLGISEGNVAVILSDEIGVKGLCKVKITPINEECMALELLEGSIYLHNGSNVPYGFNDGFKILQDTTKVRWMSIAEVYSIIDDMNKRKFNLDAAPVRARVRAAQYRFNASYTLEITYKEGTASNQLGSCSRSTSYAVRDRNPEISFGDFEFTVFQPKEPVSPFKTQPTVSIAPETADELLGITSEDDDIDEDNYTASYNGSSEREEDFDEFDEGEAGFYDEESFDEE